VKVYITSNSIRYAVANINLQLLLRPRRSSHSRLHSETSVPELAISHPSYFLTYVILNESSFSPNFTSKSEISSLFRFLSSCNYSQGSGTLQILEEKRTNSVAYISTIKKLLKYI